MLRQPTNALTILDFLTWRQTQLEVWRSLKEEDNGGTKVEVTYILTFLYTHSLPSLVRAKALVVEEADVSTVFRARFQTLKSLNKFKKT